MLFGTDMNKIIKDITNTKEFKTKPKDFNIILFVDDELLLTEIGDDLQRLLFNFTCRRQKYNLPASINKTSGEDSFTYILEVQGK